ncbi:MAG: hypothetical protein AAGI68_14240 [Planctomycetota bacterium]
MLPTMDFKAFFDSRKLNRAFRRAKVSRLRKAGSYVWRTARSSIRRRKSSSKPGSAPSSQIGRLKRLIFFGIEDEDSVVIGPRLYRRQSPTAPNLLEFGGTVRRRKTDRRTGKTRTVREKYAARPFMRPALEAEAPNFPDLFAGSVTGGV